MLIGLSHIHCPLRLHQHHDTLAPPALWSKNTRDPTMNPGGCSISSVGTVRSRRAASPDTSSAMGTTGWAERWAMKWKREAQLCSGNLSPRSGRKVSVGSPAGRMWSQPPRVVHASPAGCRLLFYISPELAKSLTRIYVLPPFPPPSSLLHALETLLARPVNGSSSKATGAMEGKMFSVGLFGGAAAHSHSGETTVELRLISAKRHDF